MGQGILITEASLSHWVTPHSVGWMISPTQRPLADNKQHSQHIDIHASSGIRTHNPSKRAAADPRFRPRRLLQLTLLLYLPTYLPACLPTYLPTYPPAYLPNYLPTHLPAYLPAYLPTCQPTYLPAYLPPCLPACLPTYLPTYLPTNFSSIRTYLLQMNN